MDLKFRTVNNGDDHNQEYIVFDVLKDCNIGSYVVADNTYSAGGRTSNKIKHTYRFPNKNVKKGDLVSVWTKSGTDTEKDNDKGTKTHRFYWGLGVSVWNNTGDVAYLMRVVETKYSKS